MIEMGLIIGGFSAPVPTDGGKGKKIEDKTMHPEIWKRWLVFAAILAAITIAAVFGPALIAGIDAGTNSNLAGTKSPDPVNNIAGTDTETNIKTVKVPFGINGCEAVSKAKPGIFYEYTDDYDGSYLADHRGFIILKKSELKDATFTFNGLKVKIIKIGGHYVIESDHIPALGTSWCTAHKLPVISSKGEFDFKNVKYVEFKFGDENINDGEYAYLVLSKRK